MTLATVTPAGSDLSYREYFDIVLSTGITYRVASGTRDLVIGGDVYSAIAMDRDEATVAIAGSETENVLKLPIDHPLVRRYLLQGVPPKQVTVTAWRIDEADVITQLWTGDVTGMSWNESMSIAEFRIPSRMSEALVRVLPNLTCSRQCPYILYGAGCDVSRDGSSPSGIPFKCVTTVLYADGRDVRVDLSNVPAGDAMRATWALHGELLHSSGERQTIRAQSDLSPGFSTVTSLSLAARIPELRMGDTVTVFAGCAHTALACATKFNALGKHGGLAYMPARNPFIPGRLV